MLLIVDAGSTKMEWAFLENRKVTQRFTTKGYNPNYADPQQFKESLEGVEVPKETVEKVYYYGSGCRPVENAALVGRLLQNTFPKAAVQVANDMLGAAHALLGHEKGIACILGTGANSCLFDGKAVVHITSCCYCKDCKWWTHNCKL